MKKLLLLLLLSGCGLSDSDKVKIKVTSENICKCNYGLRSITFFMDEYAVATCNNDTQFIVKEDTIYMDGC